MKQFKEFLMQEDGFKVRAKISDDNLIWFDIYELRLIQALHPEMQDKEKPVIKATIDFNPESKRLGELHFEPATGIIITMREDVDRWSSLMHNLFQIAGNMIEAK